MGRWGIARPGFRWGIARLGFIWVLRGVLNVKGSRDTCRCSCILRTISRQQRGDTVPRIACPVPCLGIRQPDPAQPEAMLPTKQMPSQSFTEFAAKQTANRPKSGKSKANRSGQDLPDLNPNSVVLKPFPVSLALPERRFGPFSGVDVDVGAKTGGLTLSGRRAPGSEKSLHPAAPHLANFSASRPHLANFAASRPHLANFPASRTQPQPNLPPSQFLQKRDNIQGPQFSFISAASQLFASCPGKSVARVPGQLTEPP